MKKTIEEIVKLEKIVGGGQALGELADGRKVFVWGALPGEVARIQITNSKKSYAEGIAVEIIESAPNRIEPRDADAYLATSPWQIMDFDSEQNYKSDLITEAFQLSDITLSEKVEIATDNNEFYYRNKMEYSLWWDNETGKISLAFHKRGTHQKVAISQSSIERPEIFAEASRIVAELNQNGGEARRYQSLLVRANQNGEVSSALFQKNQPHPHMKTLTDSLLGRAYSYSPNGFFQINLPVYEMALTEIAKHIQSDKVVDMYSGVGTIGLSVASDKQLTLVETNADAFRELENNITNDIRPTVRAVRAKSEEALEYITNDITLILDPPRAGLDKLVVERLLGTLPPQIIYLSCNPTTLARDVKPLLGKYKITKVQGFNFFPRTPHIENLIVLNLY